MTLRRSALKNRRKAQLVDFAVINGTITEFVTICKLEYSMKFTEWYHEECAVAKI
jgi:hypothetical protein